MKIPLCPLWPRIEDSHGSLGVLFVLAAAVLLAACFLVPVVIFAIAEAGGGLRVREARDAARPARAPAARDAHPSRPAGHIQDQLDHAHAAPWPVR